MGMTYSAKVFFGAWVPASDSFANILETYIDCSNDRPAETEITDVVINTVGNYCTGAFYYTFEARDSARSFDRNNDIEAPALLSEHSTWRADIAKFLGKHNVIVPIGWHFAGSAS
jgi:hypothetical protein